MTPEQHAALTARLSVPVWQPERPAFPESGTCPDCGGPLCGHCARVYKLTRQHLRPDGTCPYGHRATAEAEQ